MVFNDKLINRQCFTLLFNVCNVLLNFGIKKILLIFIIFMYNYVFSGMGKEVENLILENNELLATK